MKRTVFSDEHEAFRQMARGFLQKKVVPAYEEWERRVHRRASSTPS